MFITCKQLNGPVLKSFKPSCLGRNRKKKIGRARPGPKFFSLFWAVPGLKNPARADIQSDSRRQNGLLTPIMRLAFISHPLTLPFTVTLWTPNEDSSRLATHCLHWWILLLFRSSRWPRESTEASKWMSQYRLHYKTTHLPKPRRDGVGNYHLRH